MMTFRKPKLPQDGAIIGRYLLAVASLPSNGQAATPPSEPEPEPEPEPERDAEAGTDPATDPTSA